MYPQLGLIWPSEDDDHSYPLSLEGVPIVEREIERWLEDESWEATRATYKLRRVQVGLFGKWLASRGVLNVRDINRDLFRAYLQGERDRGRKASTVATKASVIRSWLSWLADGGLIAAVPRVRAPRVIRPPVSVLTVEQIEALVGACDDGSPQGVRDRAIILLLYGSGMRVSEAVALNIDDLDLPAGTGHIDAGKGDRSRTFWFPTRAAEAIRDYLERCRLPVTIPRHARALFTSRNSTRLSGDGIRLVIRQRAAAAGLNVRVHPHLFRHSAATHLLNSGADLRLVQAILGHTDLVSTQRYTHVNAQQIAETVARYHPHSRPSP